MKKNIYLSMLLLIVAISARAQWTNDAFENTLIAAGDSIYGEIYLSTCEGTGDTYVQWGNMQNEQWVPSLQRLNVRGERQWDESGILIYGNTNTTMSSGMALVATSDGAAVSQFGIDSPTGMSQRIFRISPQGEQLWGAEGIEAFPLGLRAELVAGNDGGVWALALDMENIYARYISPDGVLGNMITINGDSDRSCGFAKLVIDDQNNVFIVYQKIKWLYTFYYNKEIYVEKYAPDGSQLHGPVMLMQGADMLSTTDIYAMPDGLGGGYAWLWHPATDFYEIHAFHFDSQGETTISDLEGALVSVPDGINYHYYAYGTVDPNTHDAIFAYRQSDAAYEANHTLKVARITTFGDEVWQPGGIDLISYAEQSMEEIKISSFPGGGGCAVTYITGGYSSRVIKAVGIDDLGDQIWNTDMSSIPSGKILCDESTDFHNGQLILAWEDGRDGGTCYGQNLNPDGTLGTVIPCDAVTLTGTADVNVVNLSWNAIASATSYKVYRNGDFVADISETSFEDLEGLTAGEFCYTVVTNCSGSLSSPSNEICLQIEQCATPIDLTGTYEYHNENEFGILVGWKSSVAFRSRMLDHFSVYRSTNGNSYDEIATVNYDGQHDYDYFDIVEPGRYFYQVRAIYVLDGETCESEPAHALENPEDNAVMVIVSGMHESAMAKPKVFPVPSDGNLEIQAENLNEIAVYNELGQIVFHTEAEGNQISLDFRGLDKGIYTIKINTETDSYIRKIVIR